MTIPNYNCGQQDLYAVSRLGWNACLAHLADFTAFKPKYDAPFINARIAEIEAAENLPDSEQRVEDSRTARVLLKNKATEGLDLWQRLKRYITEAFPADQLEIKLNAAGYAHYRKADNDAWLAVQRLLLDGHNFIAANKDELSANGNMPPAFTSAYDQVVTDFDLLYNDFMNASQNNEIDTQTKITANNQVHASLMKMFLDGQEIYKKNEAVKKLFTFDQVLLTVAGPTIQGFKGSITQTNNQPVTTGEVAFTGGTNKAVKINANGHYDCPQLAAGTDYTATITVPNCEQKVITGIAVETGIMKTLDVLVTSNPLP